MDFQVRISPEALADLEAILEYSWSVFPDATERFGNALLDLVDLLARFPYIGSRLAKRRNVRRLVYTPILIYYRIHEGRKEIEVLRFRHAKREPPRI